ncbi:hypothetical protein L596_012126 [Steinernema carpocapsae]|uniref:PDZ domain-containing protein n=1 Tax=Steinernema carpocapsae TaxID=34508 RepID=A0A4U5NW63_STECR|nr:hypothetical protein L596_012126 [Steinernema carpocapsae]
MVKSAYQPLVDFACDRRNVVVEWSADKLDLKLCENLTVRSIAPKSKAIFRFVIGDQIVDVNGKVPTSPGDVSALIKRFLPKVKITVNRVADRSPVSVDRMKQIGLKRIEGYCYFTVVLRKKSDSHLGMALKTFRGKCSVQRVEPNSVASNAYMAGDNILDINGERVSDFEKFKARFKHFMTTFKVCSTVVERPESPEALQATYAMLHLFAPTDSFPADAAAIAQREIARFLQNPEPSLKPIIVLPSKEDLKTCNENPFTTEGSIYKDENTGELKPVKNQAGKLLHITHAVCRLVPIMNYNHGLEESSGDSDRLGRSEPKLAAKDEEPVLEGEHHDVSSETWKHDSGIPDSQSAPFTE